MVGTRSLSLGAHPTVSDTLHPTTKNEESAGRKLSIAEGEEDGPPSHFVVLREPSQAPFILKLGVRRTKINESEEGPEMRVYKTVLSLAIATAGGIAVQNSAFSEEYRGTMEQQLACTPDVFRLCGEHIPDSNRIVACLRQNTPQLSEACRSVFESNASAPQQPAPRRRDDQSRVYSGQ